MNIQATVRKTYDFNVPTWVGVIKTPYWQYKLDVYRTTRQDALHDAIAEVEYLKTISA